MKKRDDIEELFSTSFEGAEMTPPIDVLGNIKKEIFPIEKSNTGKGGWLFMILSITAAAGFVSMMFSDHTIENHLTNSDLKNAYSNIVQEEVSRVAEKDNTQNDNSQNDNSRNDQEQVESSNLAFDTKNEGKIDSRKLNDLELKVSSSSLNRRVSESKIINTEFNSTRKENLNQKPNKQISIDRKGERTSLKIENHSINKKEIEDQSQFLNSFEAGELKNVRVTNDDNYLSDSEKNMSTNVDRMPLYKPSYLGSASSQNIVSGPGLKSVRFNPNRFSLALYSGVTLGTNNIKEGKNTSSLLKLNESVGSNTSFEVNYMLRHPFSLSGGIDFSLRKDKLIESISTAETVQSNEWQYSYDSTIMQMDSILVTINTDVTTLTREESTLQYYSVGIPIYFNYDRFIHKRFQLSVGLGVRFSYLNYKTINANSAINYPDYSHFGMNAMLRPELRYVFSRVSIGIYAKVEYDMITGMKWQNLNRQRYGWNAGLTLRFKL